MHLKGTLTCGTPIGLYDELLELNFAEATLLPKLFL